MDRITLKMVITACALLIAIQTCVATTVSIDDSTITPGDTVTVPIRISDIENYGAGTITIKYDPAVVHVTDVVKSSDSKIVDDNIDNTAGLTGISAWNINGVNGSIIFANVVLKAVGSSGDSSPLAITVDTLQDISYEELKSDLDLSNGTFTISGSSGSAAVTSTLGSTGHTSSHSTPLLPDAAATETETGSRTDAKPATSDEPSDSAQSQSPAPADHSTESEPEHDRIAETPSMNTPFPGVIAVCLCLLIAYRIRRNGGAR